MRKTLTAVGFTAAAMTLSAGAASADSHGLVDAEVPVNVDAENAVNTAVNPSVCDALNELVNVGDVVPVDATGELEAENSTALMPLSLGGLF